jgi:hypothetical protein
MNKYLKKIDEQIGFNKGKNIFNDSADVPLKFIDDTVNAISDIKELSIESEAFLIDYATDKAIGEFCRINQYYAFNSQARNDLRNIYSDLFSTIKAEKHSIDSISSNHYKKIKEWLSKTNPFAEKIYTNAGYALELVPCSEYSPELQINILKISINAISGPVLDIGCGKQGKLVKYLRKQGIDAYGIDRFSFGKDVLTNADWFEYSYGTEKWGTIISHLGFSNHFKHHHFREDGNYIEYAGKYMEILKSLKTGGHFHYVPDLPFIELYLDPGQFKIDAYEVGVFNCKTTVITRLK